MHTYIREKLLFISDFGSHNSLVAAIQQTPSSLGIRCILFTSFLFFFDKLLLCSLLFSRQQNLLFFFILPSTFFPYISSIFILFFYAMQKKDRVPFLCRCGKREPRFFITRAKSTSHPLRQPANQAQSKLFSHSTFQCRVGTMAQHAQADKPLADYFGCLLYAFCCIATDKGYLCCQ